MIPRLLFWSFVALHLWKVVSTLFYAEDLERAKRGNRDLGWRGVTKILVAAALYVPGFFYARFSYLWLLLGLLTLVTGLLALATASGFRRQGASGEELIPENTIGMRAAARRRTAAVEFSILILWTYAWREVVSQ